MKKIIVISPLLVLLLVSAITFAFQIAPAKAATITVPDDYSTIQEAINNAADGDTILVKAGTYFEHVVINKTVSLLGEDVSMTIIDGSGTGNVFAINKNSVNITGFTVQNSGGILGNAGLRLDNVSLCSILGNRIRGNFAGIWFEECSKNLIIANNITANVDDGIVFNYSHNNTVSENHIALHEYFGVVINWSHNNTICWNNVTQTLGPSHGDGINLWRSCSNTIFQNRVEENNRYGIHIEVESNNNTVSKNAVTGNRFGIKILSSAYTEILNNTVAHNYGSDWDAGIHLDYAGHARIHDNEITDNHHAIVVYSNSPRVSVWGNNVTENDFGIRVACGGSNYFNATGNIVANNGNGICITGWESASNYATISKNLLTNNTFDAVGLGYYSSYNTVSQNNISQNGCGFFIEYSAQNTIFNNNMVNNTQQVDIVSVSVNAWDDGYPSGGNYWSDYSGIDVCRNFYQNETGSDGIGDTPYVIDAANRDNYPLMKPYPWASHDIGITALAVSKTIVGQGFNVSINGMLFNYGNETENFNITIYANTTILATFTDIILTSRNFTSIAFTWNTTGFAYGNYTVKAVADTVPSETEMSDNICIARFSVHVGVLGDVSGIVQGAYDGICDMQDVDYLILLFNTRLNSANWDPNADLNNDSVCNMRDVVIAIINFNKQE